MYLSRKPRRRKQPSLFERHPGQAIVLIALVMIVLLAFTALAIDGGQLYFLQRDAQNAADAAIMAALFELCKDPNLDTDNVIPPGPYTGNQIRAANAIQAGKMAAIENGFDDLTDTVSLSPGSSPPARSLASHTTVTVTVPYDPGTGLSYNDVEVVIIADKPSELIHMVYQGPLQVRARTAGHCEAGHPFNQSYAMYGGGDCSPYAVDYQGSGHSSNIVGGIGGNGDVHLTGGGTVVPNPISGSGSVTGNSPSVPGANPGGDQADVSMPEIWSLDEFKLPDGQYAKEANLLGQYHYTVGDLTSLPLGADGKVEPGIYYVTGNISLHTADYGSGAEGVTFVTPGQFSSGGIDVPFTPYDTTSLPPMPLIFANGGGVDDCQRQDIGISGSHINWTGVLYAPHGLINLSGSNTGSLNGCMVGYRVSVSASDFTLVCTPDKFPPVKPIINITG